MRYFATLLVLLSLGLFTAASIGCGNGVDPVDPTPPVEENDNDETDVAPDEDPLGLE